MSNSLLNKSLKAKLQPLESTNNLSSHRIKVPCRFYLPGTCWAWYPFEFDGVTTFYGFVKGDFDEFGYFTLEELSQRKGPFGSRVEKDKFFSSCKLSELMKTINK